MSRQPKPVQMPFESTTTVPETPDIAAFRAFQPNTNLLEPAVDAQFGQQARAIDDQYNAYSGIPSAVARNRQRAMALGDLASQKSSALAQGNRDVQALRMAQLESVAGLTRGQHQSGFNTQAPQSSGTLNSIISGGASVGGALIIA